MKVDIRGHRDLTVTAALREHVLRRMHFALGRFGRRVGRVTVRLSDLNGPRGGVDKTCRIGLSLPRAPEMVIEDTDGDLYVAIDRAAERAGRTVGRHLSRSRDLHRMAPPRPVPDSAA